MRHYKGFVYTPEPKTAWDNLPMNEKAAMIKVAVSNGITNLQEIKDKYNEFAEGGHIYDGKTEPTQKMVTTGGAGFVPATPTEEFTDKILSTVSKKVMNYIKGAHDTGTYFSYDSDMEPYAGPAQDTYLLPRRIQEKEFLKRGYIKGEEKDYGLVKKAVGNRNLPVYQRNPDAISRDNLIVIGNIHGWDPWYGDSNTSLEHAGSYPTAVYIDGEGNFYQKGWDLNDYGGKTGSTIGVLSDIVDRIGNPTVVTTGYQPVKDSQSERFIQEVTPMMAKKGLVPTEIDNKIQWTLPGVTIVGKRDKKKDGGSIHIAPSKRGTFTAAASKHGMGVQEFASKVLANKDDYSPAMVRKANFARNSKHWKHGLGGNLFDDESQSTQQMQIGREYWQSQANQPTFMEGLAEFNRQQNLKKERQNKALRQQISSTGKGLFDEAVKSAQTESNDNLWINAPLTYKKAKNPHLAHRAEGAKAHATWEEEHPNLSAWGNLAGAVPFAVAAIPFGAGIVAGGDALAATTAGQAVTSGLAPLATAASTSVAGAPLYTWADVGLSSLFAGHGVQTAIDEGGISPTTALELLPVTKVVKPAVETGYNAAKPAIDRTVTTLQNNYPALFDPYTSWDATLGYHGDNIFSRALGTIGRRYGYTPKTEVPEFHRRLKINKPEDMRITDDGNLIISSGRTGEGHDGIVNFATSEPARSHQQHKMLSSIDDYIIDPKAIGTQDFKSIQPSDTFFETGELAIDPKNITLISGNTDVLNQARSMGIRTLSSPRLRELKAATAPQSQGGKGLLARINTAHSGNDGQLGTEIQRLASMRGTPTISDYAYFENMTGLNSGVIPNTEFNLENASEILGRWGKIRRTPTFNNVVYDPATSIETIYRGAKMGIRPWTDYYEALEKMPSARSFNGELLDWSADKWLGRRVGGFDSEDVAKLAGHTPEYLNIEKTAKANGTWLKNADGSDWQGYINSRGKVSKDPHVWVMQQSSAGQKWSDELLGTGMNSERAAGFPTYNGELWTATTPKVSQTFMSELKEPDFAWKSLLSRVRHGYIPQWKMNLERMLDLQKGRAFGITVPKNMKTVSVNAEGRDWNRVTPVGESLHRTTKDYVKDFLGGENQAIRINNVNEWHRPFGINTDDLILGKDTPRKIWEGNNGDLDPLILNGYKAFGGYLTIPNKNKRE